MIHKKTGLAAGALLLCCGLLFLLCQILFGTRADPFLGKIYDDEYRLEGTLVLLGSEVRASRVVEQHSGEDYSIAYAGGRTYTRLDSEYYIESEEEGRISVSDFVPDDDMAGIVDMFDRKSILANYSFRDLELAGIYSAEIPDASLEGTVTCLCREYLPRGDAKEPAESLRVYFLDQTLYAIQRMELFIFFVDSLNTPA